ncbi:ATPase [bacterium (Candidatus Blackallbacteria) CG17_big_fil_post_rev_8_21_14_2_50_48_46]|uniref:ATPase n=1 Tax=bacterium (Candidatus Blackallbacteria) CG17_big_fil_post_rev_8_21_14_2_50_48_46 TaxID=2014261 RepID=A0A2M7G3E8_9BACT|nr:MAG: ATPase [bacterium (Candidatus Blackallbacteria) CG18_big_fil_WC_8_21_14_2_50_49_26]PIW16307.1 MAG: ATPase [bacterium (Candidatus Blackallbacteria) CG17_big_fil_post_rev_8_21_14_2_50_48_46]PIW45321.1 MAG: ATPase [bacterium (Candidatus Blackallbacteria) CG13_big_fil_rev_8_21_14_2_50_49_14]
MDNTIRYFQKVSKSPTNPHLQTERKEGAPFYEGLGNPPITAPVALGLAEKLRQAYFWIVNHAIISPYYDIEYHDGPRKSFSFGDQWLHLPSDQSYSSFVLLPLLNFAVRRKCLLIGGPGRGKTASAVLMGVLAGYPVQEVRRAIQHGQPQMTIADLLGNPLPAHLIEARNMDEIQIAWRKWLGMRVKIIDEYNRIPTRTQSALLTVMGDNYAEVFDQIYECPESAWFLTANAEEGGGTYQVIEALRDRIDIVVKTLHFSSRFLGDLILRVENDILPEEVVPSEIIFSNQEMDQLYQQVLQVSIPYQVQRRIEFFASQFEYCGPAGEQFEYKTKDTLRLSALDPRYLLAQEIHPDPLLALGAQTLNGLSVRALLTLILFCKAMAWFRGNSEVELEDVRQILPFVLHDKLIQNPEALFFEQPGHQVYRVDKISWLRKLFDLACLAYDRQELETNDPVARLSAAFAQGLEGVTDPEVRQRMHEIEILLESFSQAGPLSASTYEDAIKLKYLHQRYTNYLKWLQWKT